MWGFAVTLIAIQVGFTYLFDWFLEAVELELGPLWVWTTLFVSTAIGVNGNSWLRDHLKATGHSLAGIVRARSAREARKLSGVE